MTAREKGQLQALLSNSDLLDLMTEARPKLGGESAEKRLQNADMADGWERATNFLISLVGEERTGKIASSRYVNTETTPKE